MTDTPKRSSAKCRVNWQRPYRTGTICNYVDEVTNECKQTDRNRCPCGGIVRSPAFPCAKEYEQAEGCLLILCECGNDTFRIVDKSDWLPEFEQWEGDELMRICTNCGKKLPCPSEAKKTRNISRDALSKLLRRDL